MIPADAPPSFNGHAENTFATTDFVCDVEAGFSGFTAMLTMHQFVPRLFEELADIVLGHPIDAGVDDLGCRLVIVELEQRVHRLLPISNGRCPTSAAT